MTKVRNPKNKTVSFPSVGISIGPSETVDIEKDLADELIEGGIVEAVKSEQPKQKEKLAEEVEQ